MAEGAALDVLSFVEVPVERKSAWGDGVHLSRQIAINGVLLGTFLANRLRRPIDQSTPMVDGRAGSITPAAYLRALLGGPKDDLLPEGRIALGYCDGCLDASCGVLLGATLGIDGSTVLWAGIGFEREEAGPAPKLKPFWKRGAVEEEEPTHIPWIATPFAPEITLRFDRDHYLETIQAERRRLAAAQ